MKTIFITGGAGYVGSVLVTQLLGQGYQVTVFDSCFFGQDHLPLEHPHFQLIKGDIRDESAVSKSLEGMDCVLHLACISNDPSFVLDEELSRSINYDCFEPLVLAAKQAGVKRFIYCSSSSVYGVSDRDEVTEETPLVPLTLYNKYKGLCEPLLLKQQSDAFTCCVIRPATICGYSPRMRFDLSVNILTNHAFHKGVITVFGGKQKRPNLHIKDMCDLYQLLIEVPAQKIQGETFNAGYQNYTLLEMADFIKNTVEKAYPQKAPIDIQVSESNDQRSYHIGSKKIDAVLGFRPKRRVEEAVLDICNAFEDNLLPNSFSDDRYYNVKTMQSVTTG